MRQHKTICVLVVFVCMLSMTSCGSSKQSAPPGNSHSPTVHVPQPARATPSVSAKLVCAPDTQNELAAVLGVRTTQPVVPTWARASHLYSCRYTYHNGVMALSLKELSSKTETDSYFTSLARGSAKPNGPGPSVRASSSPPKTARLLSARTIRSSLLISPDCPHNLARHPLAGQISHSLSPQRSWTAGPVPDRTPGDTGSRQLANCVGPQGPTLGFTALRRIARLPVTTHLPRARSNLAFA